MPLEIHHLTHGTRLELPPGSAARARGLILVVGGGRGCVLRASDPLAGLWLPLRGRLQLGAATTDNLVRAGELSVSEPDARVHAVGRGASLWIAVLGGVAAWQQALGELSDPPISGPVLIPARHVADRDLRRRAIALARSRTGGEAMAGIEALLERLAALQQLFAPAVARCPGRTYAQRRQVFLRLQRVRNYLAANCQLEIDNDALAKMASYSPWHFIRAFRAAYQETPHACLVRMRLERARRLLRASPLAISEIALASGFENRCAFSRLFRQRFGITAGAMRRHESAGGGALRVVR